MGFFEDIPGVYLRLKRSKGVSDVEIEDARIQLVKAMLDEFPELRRWVKAYLTVYP